MQKNEFIAGGISGIIQGTIGHPLDTMKTLSQYKQKVVIETNPQILYRGFIYPFMSKGVTSASRFMLGDAYTKYFNNNWYIGGFFTGITTAPILSIFDLYKTQSQVGMKINYFKLNPFKGLGIFTIRDSIGMASCLGFYHSFKDRGIHPFFAGGIAGVACWSLIYPFDAIQTRIKTDIAKTYYEAIKQGSLYKGISLAIGRVFLLNAIGFYVYQKTKDYLYGGKKN